MAGLYFTGLSKPAGFNVITDDLIACRTVSEVLPINSPGTPVRPTVPIITVSIALASVKAGIQSTGSPFIKWALIA